MIRKTFRSIAAVVKLKYDIDQSPNREIEVLRALAILVTIFYHLEGTLLGQHSKFYQSLVDKFSFYTGVDLFFCISGFVITRSFIANSTIVHNGYSNAYFRKSIAFWIRRIYRIMPSVILWLGIVILLSIFFNKSTYFGSPWTNCIDALASVLNVANFHFSRCLATPTSFLCGWNMVYWSLSLEEQFYLVFPLLLMLPRRWACLGLIALFVGQMFISRDIYALFLRTDALCLGILLAFLVDAKEYLDIEPVFLKSVAARWVVFLFLMFCIVAIPGRTNSTITSIAPCTFTLIALVCVALVFIASFDAGYLMKDSILRRILVWVGMRSFAMYLIHDPMLLLAREILFRLQPSDAALTQAQISLTYGLCIALIFVLSDLNYRLVETPLRRRGKALSRQYIAAGEPVAENGSAAI